MDVRTLITKVGSSTRDFFWPRYRPELYYMRGPGPATARRAVMVGISKHPLSPPPSERRKHVPLAADRYKRDVHREGIALHGRQIGQLHNPQLVMR